MLVYRYISEERCAIFSNICVCVILLFGRSVGVESQGVKKLIERLIASLTNIFNKKCYVRLFYQRILPYCYLLKVKKK